ncbi:ABC transporter permease [Wenxinia marina]|uniref:ABC-type spermidine/putrescine transport system, permease component I n=1 Tax=Wenxinia marina DSM 24838 TaxID=1123501 RepID=A0A0D0NIW1_9RHOB|nr:ABC transporter permease [Wenxinia marina]KIQ68250.1 ABC-type spermidine/putrescine transport system, permease component I [Wenxinia marina DSM 24838]GGL77104.1 ABC transporter permease [Wenxinia marina]
MRRRGGTLWNWLLSAPALLVLVLAASGPLVIVLVYSFLSPGNMGGVAWEPSTDAWFRLFFKRDIFDPEVVTWNEAHLVVFWRSVSLSLQTTAICAILGFPTAWFIATRAPHRRALWLFLITIPFWTNLLVRTFAIQELIRNTGTINSLLLRLGVIGEPIQMMYTDFAVLVGMAYVFLPLMVLPLYAAMDKLDMRLVEAGYDLYGGRLQVLRHVIFPLVKPGFVAGSILVFIPAIGAYVTPRVLGGGRTMMLGNLIELQFGQGRNWPLGSAMAMLLLIVVVAALVLYLRWANAEPEQRNG